MPSAVIRGLILWHAEMKVGGEIIAQPTRDIRFPAHGCSIYFQASPLLGVLSSLFQATSNYYNHDIRHNNPSSAPASKHLLKRSLPYKRHDPILESSLLQPNFKHTQL
jgi:hypothetical protein